MLLYGALCLLESASILHKMAAGFHVGSFCKEQTGEIREEQNNRGFVLGLMPFSSFYSWMELPLCFPVNLMGMVARATKTIYSNGLSNPTPNPS